MKEVYFKCNRKDCFANQCGYCKALTAPTRRQPCLFFKTIDEHEKNMEASRRKLKYARK